MSGVMGKAEATIVEHVHARFVHVISRSEAAATRRIRAHVRRIGVG
jgi:hypothetical protein